MAGAPELVQAPPLWDLAETPCQGWVATPLQNQVDMWRQGLVSMVPWGQEDASGRGLLDMLHQDLVVWPPRIETKKPNSQFVSYLKRGQGRGWSREEQTSCRQWNSEKAVNLGPGRAVGRRPRRWLEGLASGGWVRVAGRDGVGRWPEGLEGRRADLGWGWRQVRTARRETGLRFGVRWSLNLATTSSIVVLFPSPMEAEMARQSLSPCPALPQAVGKELCEQQHHSNVSLQRGLGGWQVSGSF